MAAYPEFHLLPEGASNLAGRVDALFWFLTAISGFITLLVLVLIVYFGIRYRRRTEDEVPPETAEGLVLEIGWTILPALILAGRLVWLGAGMLGVFTVLAACLANPFWAMQGAARFAATNAFFEHLGLAGGFVLAALVAEHARREGRM